MIHLHVYVARYHAWKEPLTVRNRTMTKGLAHAELLPPGRPQSPDARPRLRTGNVAHAGDGMTHCEHIYHRRAVLVGDRPMGSHG